MSGLPPPLSSPATRGRIKEGHIDLEGTEVHQ
jgi:hypothetical protein